MSITSNVYKRLGSLLSKHHTGLVKFKEGDKTNVFNLIKKIKGERKFLLRYTEAYNLYSITRNTAKIDGAIAEVGTFNGASAKLISLAKGNKPFYIFDSFEGLPPTEEVDAKHFHEGQFQSNFDVVKKYLSEFDNVHIYKGFFPQKNSEAVENVSFSFVHLDVDLYDSTLKCLEFFYPRLNKGGCLVSHDYYAEGVYKAFKEFFADKTEPIIELPEDQAMIVKLS